MAKEFKNGEIAYFKDGVSIDFVNGEITFQKKLSKDDYVKIVKSKKIPKEEGSIGYYVAIEENGAEFKSISPIPEVIFYSHIQWDEKKKKDLLILKLEQFASENLKVDLVEEYLIKLQECIQKNLITQLEEEHALSCIDEVIRLLNSCESIVDVSMIFDTVLDSYLPF